MQKLCQYAIVCNLQLLVYEHFMYHNFDDNDYVQIRAGLQSKQSETLKQVRFPKQERLAPDQESMAELGVGVCFVVGVVVVLFFVFLFSKKAYWIL